MSENLDHWQWLSYYGRRFFRWMLHTKIRECTLYNESVLLAVFKEMCELLVRMVVCPQICHCRKALHRDNAKKTDRSQFSVLLRCTWQSWSRFSGRSPAEIVQDPSARTNYFISDYCRSTHINIFESMAF